MPAPVPYDGFEKRIGLEIYADNVVVNYAQLFRQINDATTDPLKINLKNVRQAHEQALLLNKHLTEPFGATFDRPIFRRVLATAFERKGLLWTTPADMMADLTAIRDAGLAFSAYVVANVPQDYGTIRMRNDGTREEIVSLVDKAANAPMLVEIAKVRDLFGADPKV